MEKAIMDKPVREDSGFYLLGGNIDSEQTRFGHPGNLIKENYIISSSSSASPCSSHRRQCHQEWFSRATFQSLVRYKYMLHSAILLRKGLVSNAWGWWMYGSGLSDTMSDGVVEALLTLALVLSILRAVIIFFLFPIISTDFIQHYGTERKSGWKSHLLKLWEIWNLQIYFPGESSSHFLFCTPGLQNLSCMNAKLPFLILILGVHRESERRVHIW